jgi:integrase
MTPDPAVAATTTLRAVPAAGDELDDRYTADVWRAADLGVPARRGVGAVSFTGIDPPWLREAVKRWARQRLATGCALNTIRAGTQAFTRFSGFLNRCQPPVGHPIEMDRALLERYLAWLAPLSLADSTKALSRVFLRSFLEDNRRYHWVAGIPAEATIYPDEISARRRTMPRFIPEFVMNQLESGDNLAQLHPTYRGLVVLITETGLRVGDACTLPFDPVLTDSAGWRCLRFASSKMRAEQLVPLSTRAVKAVRDQQRHVRDSRPDGSAWLFPSRSDPHHPVPYSTFYRVIADWQHCIGLHDETGCATTITVHRLRHTFGTRLINSGVPQHVIQRLLGHASPGMTAVYAHLHDTTIRSEFERYCQTRVDVQGQLLGFDPQAATADAEWVKHRLSRAADALPNGYCGRPPSSTARIPMPV